MKKYNVIYADPPWKYNDTKTGGSMTSGVENKYKAVMSLQDICNMPLQELIEDNAVLFLWTTVPLLPEALEVVGAWGFKYKTMLTWRKSNKFGMGHWFRGQLEHLIFAVKGNVKPFGMQVVNFYESRAGRHSIKPDYFRKLITMAAYQTINNPKKLELFARDKPGLFFNSEYEGWDLYGNEVTGSITLPNHKK